MAMAEIYKDQRKKLLVDETKYELYHIFLQV